jgi:AraC family transcriptional regulator of arabinose operon
MSGQDSAQHNRQYREPAQAIANTLLRVVRGARPTGDTLERILSSQLNPAYPPIRLVDSVTLERIVSLIRKIDIPNNLSARFSSDGSIADNETAIAFIHTLLLQVPVTAILQRPLVCGQTFAERDQWTAVPMQHGSNYAGWTLHYNRFGKVEFNWGDNRQICAQGDIVLIPPQTNCSYQLAPRARQWVHDWFVFQPSERWLQWLDWVENLKHAVILPSVPERRALGQLAASILELNAEGPPCGYALQENLFEQLLIRLRNTFDGAPVTNRSPSLAAAKQYIRKNLNTDFSLQDLSDHCHISASHLATIFRSNYGCSIMQWRDHMRMEKAGHLLRGSRMSVADVAELVGYEDPKYFARRFKAIKGRPPSQYRTY